MYTHKTMDASSTLLNDLFDAIYDLELIKSKLESATALITTIEQFPKDNPILIKFWEKYNLLLLKKVNAEQHLEFLYMLYDQSIIQIKLNKCYI